MTNEQQAESMEAMSSEQKLYFNEINGISMFSSKGADLSEAKKIEVKTISDTYNLTSQSNQEIINSLIGAEGGDDIFDFPCAS